MTESGEEKNLAILANFIRDLRLMEFPGEGMVIIPPIEEIQGKWLSGIPFIQCSPPQVDALCFLEFAGRVKNLAASYEGECQEGLEQVLQEMGQNEERLKQMVDAVFCQDEEAVSRIVAEMDNDSEDVSFLISHTAQPFFREFARRLKPYVNIAHWDKGICPFCGSPAHLGRLDGETKKRYLYCAMCDTEWPFKRLACPRCLSESPEDLQFFTVEGAEKYRVYTCAKCRGYIKTVVEDKMEPQQKELFLEELRTVGLDFLANKEGYQLPSRLFGKACD